MAAEPILVVDDTPVNLKLTRILLVNEGYSVLTAASAEEAIELLKTCHPSLVLADIQLPGMDGLELARRIKQNPATGDILVVALTAYAMKGDEQRAMEAGCDGYITKPIDTRTLGARLREYLGRRSQPAAAERAAEPTAIIPEADMSALRRTFLNEGLERSRTLLMELDGAFNATEAAKPVHQWSGTAALLGYSAIGRQSREVEGLLRERPIDQALLREKIADLVASFSNPQDAEDKPMPSYVLEALSGKRVALVELPGAAQERLSAALERADALTEAFEVVSNSIPTTLFGYQLAVIHVRPHTPVTAWLPAASQLWEACPIVLTGSRDDLLALPQASQALARDFLMDSWQPDEALVRLSLALSRPPLQIDPLPVCTVRPVVLVADGDPAVVALARSSLQKFGMESQVATDGASALQSTRSLLPGALVLDLNLPGLRTDEVVSTIRSEKLPVRILLLAARQQEEEVIRDIGLGADDYVVKPLSPMELAARLQRLLGR